VFHLARERIGLDPQRAFLRFNLELVERPGSDAGHEQLPDPAAPQLAHRKQAAIPAIEITNQAHALGVRCPDREADTRHALGDSHASAQGFPQL
jgi:hypothetical protein